MIRREVLVLDTYFLKRIFFIFETNDARVVPRCPQVSRIDYSCPKMMYIHRKTIRDTWGQLGTAAYSSGQLALHLDSWRYTIYGNLDMGLEF